MKTEEKVVATPLPRKKRDPRNKRDPRRRAVSVEQQDENSLSTENLNPGAKTEKPGDLELKELEKVAEPKNLEVDWEDPVDNEDSMEKAKIEKLENLLVNLEEPEEIVAMEEEKIEKTENLLQILKALPLPIDPEMEEEQ